MATGAKTLRNWASESTPVTARRERATTSLGDRIADALRSAFAADRSELVPTRAMAEIGRETGARC